MVGRTALAPPHPRAVQAPPPHVPTAPAPTGDEPFPKNPIHVSPMPHPCFTRTDAEPIECWAYRIDQLNVLAIDAIGYRAMMMHFNKIVWASCGGR